MSRISEVDSDPVLREMIRNTPKCIQPHSSLTMEYRAVGQAPGGYLYSLWINQCFLLRLNSVIDGDSLGALVYAEINKSQP